MQIFGWFFLNSFSQKSVLCNKANFYLTVLMGILLSKYTKASLCRLNFNKEADLLHKKFCLDSVLIHFIKSAKWFFTLS